jgi:hypothetical protein
LVHNLALQIAANAVKHLEFKTIQAIPSPAVAVASWILKSWPAIGISPLVDNQCISST